MIRKLYDRIDQTPVGQKISSDVACRTSLPAGWSQYINLIYAAVNGVPGIVQRVFSRNSDFDSFPLTGKNRLTVFLRRPFC